ncbi:hypothetical protein VTK73DRAFT_2619 [Phialemonium thermophilum]|uniref:Secreted protein n=1 Tax=Phialemonium thermophilum TaxID=223376 RepID=A0ABR3VQQ4_9PEZI
MSRRRQTAMGAAVFGLLRFLSLSLFFFFFPSLRFTCQREDDAFTSRRFTDPRRRTEECLPCIVKRDFGRSAWKPSYKTTLLYPFFDRYSAGNQPFWNGGKSGMFARASVTETEIEDLDLDRWSRRASNSHAGCAGWTKYRLGRIRAAEVRVPGHWSSGCGGTSR